MSLANYAQSTFTDRVRKFARCTNFSGVGVMWDGATDGINQPDYQGWLNTEDTIHAISSSADDTEGGSGAYALTIQGQGSDGIEITDTVLLNGTTEVTFTKKFEIIYRAAVVNLDAIVNGNTSPVTNRANHGIIRIYPDGAPTRIMAAILAGLGQTQMAVWRCPKDHYGEFLKLGVYAKSVQGVVARLFTRPNKETSWRSVGSLDQDNYLTEPEWPEGVGEYIAPGTDFCLVINASTSTNASSLLWVKLHKIHNYEELLLEEAAGV